MFNLAIFVSGRGSNLLAIAKEINLGNLKAKISAVVSNKSDCGAIEYAIKENLDNYVLSESKSGNNYISYGELTRALTEKGIDLVVLAGFLKKIPPELIGEFRNRIINIHPALLPSFGGKGMYGINVHRAVFNSSAKVSGATVHFVDEIYDNGKIIDQRAVDICDVKSPEEIAQRVLKEEHKLLPSVIKKFINDDVRITENRIYID